jgi:large subunit ribosomal protein L30
LNVVTQKAHREIRIKWVRSGIGFSYRAKEVIRSLGLRRLNHVVERPDTPQVRGLLAKVPHLVEVVSEVSRPAWLSVPEYTILPAEAAAEVAARRKRRPAGEALSEEKGEVEVQEPVAQRAAKAEAAEASKKPAAPSKAVPPKKRAKAAEERKGKAAAKAGETKKKEKAASPRGGAKSAGKKKK